MNDWLALLRVHEGGVTTLADCFFNKGRPVDDYLAAALAELIRTGYLALGAAVPRRQQQVKVAYTRRLTDDDLTEIGCVSLTATTLQKFVPKAFDVRLTVIGERWFPIAIHAATDGAHTDWRSDPSALTYKFVSVPDTVVDSVLRYLEHMNLAYAGLDFVITPDDRWVLLEANSGPQFGWLEAATGAPMVDAMAELLMKGNM